MTYSAEDLSSEPSVPGPPAFKCILQYPLLFPVTIAICCLVLVISHAKLCFQFYTTFPKDMKSTEKAHRGAATMTEFLPHTLWKQKGEARRSANTGQREETLKALTCHFQSWEKLPGQPETQEIMGWPHVPSSILTEAHQLKTESSSLHRLDCSPGQKHWHWSWY